MAKVVQCSYDKRVATAIELEALTNIPEGTTIIVTNAIDDVNAGAGEAVYRFSNSGGWKLIQKDYNAAAGFNIEELTIVNGSVTLSQLPTDNKIWGVTILLGSEIMAEITESSYSINAISGVVTGLDEWNGKVFRCTYSYGVLTPQISSYVNGRISEILGTAPENLDTLGELATSLTDLGTINDFEGSLG